MQNITENRFGSWLNNSASIPTMEEIRQANDINQNPNPTGLNGQHANQAGPTDPSGLGQDIPMDLNQPGQENVVGEQERFRARSNRGRDYNQGLIEFGVSHKRTGPSKSRSDEELTGENVEVENQTADNGRGSKRRQVEASQGPPPQSQ